MRRGLSALPPSVWTRVRVGVPYRRRWCRQAGFSLLETMIAAVILAILLVSLMVVLVRGQDTFDTLAVRAATQMRIQGTLDRMVKEMRTGSLGNLTTGPPLSPAQFLVEGQSYDNVTFLPVADVIGSVLIWDQPVTYWFQLDPGEAATPNDDDGDGLANEGSLIRSSAGSDTVVCSRVTAVSFMLSNDQLRISLTASAVDDDRYEHRFTGVSSLSFRNQ